MNGHVVISIPNATSGGKSEIKEKAYGNRPYTDYKQKEIGEKLRVGPAAVLQISKIGKECHKHCAIYHQVGDCIMPRQGVFFEMLGGGKH